MTSLVETIKSNEARARWRKVGMYMPALAAGVTTDGHWNSGASLAHAATHQRNTSVEGELINVVRGRDAAVCAGVFVLGGIMRKPVARLKTVNGAESASRSAEIVGAASGAAHVLSVIDPAQGLCEVQARGAIKYALVRWTALTRYRDDGPIEIDNNSVERSIRPVVLGRRNYLFAGSDAGGEGAANIYSLIGSAMLNAMDRRRSSSTEDRPRTPSPSSGPEVQPPAASARIAVWSFSKHPA